MTINFKWKANIMSLDVKDWHLTKYFDTFDEWITFANKTFAGKGSNNNASFTKFEYPVPGTKIMAAQYFICDGNFKFTAEVIPTEDKD